MYCVLFIALAAITAAAFCLSRYELLSPITLAPLGFTLAALLALIGTASWNQVALQWNALAIIVIGCIAFVAGGYCVDCFARRRERGQTPQNEAPELVMASGSVETYVKYGILIALILAAIVLRVYETYRLGSQWGLQYDGFNDLSQQVKLRTTAIFTTQNIRFGNGFSIVERQMEKAARVAAYVSIALLVINLMRHLNNRKRYIDIGLAALTFGMFCLLTFIAGGRGEIIYCCMGAMLIWFVLALRAKKNAAIWLSVRLLVALISLFFLISIGFYGAGKLVGRTPASDPVEYISFYLGGGIPSLQWMLDHIASIATVPGGATFYGVYALLYKARFIDDLHLYSIEWVNLGGHNSNIFTMFGRYYLDFRWLGVVIFSVLAGVAYTLLYRWVKRTTWPAVLVVFAWTGAYLFDVGREEFLFSRFLSIGNLVTMVLLVLGMWFMTTSFTDMLKNRKAKKINNAVPVPKECAE